MAILTFEPLSTTHSEHLPTQEGQYLVLCATEGPTFIKKSTSRPIRTGVKLQIPANHVAVVAFRRKHGDGYVLTDPSFYTSSPKLGADGKAVEGSDGEGLTGEISVLAAAPMTGDLTIRFGEAFAVAYLLSLIKLEAKKPVDKK